MDTARVIPLRILHFVILLALGLSMTLAWSLSPAAAQAAENAPPDLSFLSDGLPDEALAYEQRIGKLMTRQGDAVVRSRGFSAEAAEAMQAGDPGAAAQGFRAAASLNPDEFTNWLGIATAALATKPANGTERYKLPREATSAAQIAFELAKDRQDRAATLALMAQALARRNLSRPALEAYKASLRQAESPAVRESFAKLRAQRGFRILNHSVDSESRSPRICVQFSEELRSKGIDYASYVTVNGAVPGNLKREGRQLCADGLKHGERYKISLRQGLPSSIEDEALLQQADLSVYVRDRSPTARFTGSNFVLPRIGSKGIPVVTVNAAKVDMTIYRVGERALTQLLTGKQFLRNLDRYAATRLTKNLGERVWKGQMEAAIEPNKEVTTSFPVEKAIPERKPGVYVIVARAEGDRAESWKPQATQWFVISDIGLATFAGNDGLNVFARSLSTAMPAAGVKLQLLSRGNAVLGETQTDNEGRGTFTPGLTRGTGAQSPALVIASSKSGDFVFLDLTRPGFDLSDRGVAGRAAPQSLDLFLYTERGIYRAGETVHVAGLLRDTAAKAAARVPLTFVFERPDGVEHRRVVSRGAGLGGHHVELPLQASAMRGSWRVTAYADPKGKALAQDRFLVEDFVPDRIAFDLSTPREVLSRTSETAVELAGKYLYGAPAAGLVLEGELNIAPVRNLKDFTGYQFGLHDEGVTPVGDTLSNLPVTDASGRAQIKLTSAKLPKSTSPLEATVTVRMREGGGRAVERRLTLPVEGAQTLIGLKPLFEGGSVAEGETASFDVIALDRARRQVPAAGLKWSLVRIERRYQWYRTGSGWNYEPVTQTAKVADGTIDASADAPVRLAAKVTWGRYRLDVESPDPDGPAASIMFSAGWYVESKSTDTPDGLEVGLDKASYAPGATARLTISPRYAGKALVVAGTEKVLFSRTIDVPEKGAVVDIPVGEDWSGTYITVAHYRPGDGPQSRGPARAVGIKWLAVDPGERKLAVKLDAPEKSRPRGTFTVPVSLEGLAEGEQAYVMLAAVDVGILNLTGYKAPDPAAWYFGQRRLGMEIRDMYGRLIDGTLGATGLVRSGGDQAGLGMKGAPPTQPLMAFVSGPVTLDGDGKAEIEVSVPQFNGTVRLMAVAWTASGVGQGTQDVIVRDPVVITSTTPRFLAPGDQTDMRVEIANTDGPAGSYKVSVKADGAVTASETGGSMQIDLAPGEVKVLSVPLTAGFAGPAVIDVTVSDGGAVNITHTTRLDVRAPQLPLTEQRIVNLAANGGSITVSKDLLDGFRLENSRIAVGVSRAAGLDVASLLMALDRYPYGCTEQTTSRALPLLYLSELTGLDAAGSDADLRKRIQKAIDRVLANQSSSGSFGLWSASGGDLWLDAYVTDFLTRARERDFTVPDVAFTQALDNLQNNLSFGKDLKAKSAQIAYALYVLARNKRASVGDLRYFVDARLDAFNAPMSRAHLAAGLGLYGDRLRSGKAFASALDRLDTIEADKFTGQYYGSKLRDGAAVLALAAETPAGNAIVKRLISHVSDARQEKTHTSTQENVWMVLAARALRAAGEPLKLEVDGESHSGNLARSLAGELIAATPITVTNRSDEDLKAVLTVNAVPDRPLPAGGNGFEIERQYYDRSGNPVDPAGVAQNQRLVVVLKVTEQTPAVSRLLVSDLLPAGFEIDNPRLLASSDLQSLKWLPDTLGGAHTEFRKDRFIASFNRKPGDKRAVHLAYMVRAVSPGKFVHPAATVEDMYRPHLSARTAMGRVTVNGTAQ